MGSASVADARGRLSVIGVSHAFGGVRALDHVDFELRPGRIHGLVGENGAGKSTLIQIMVGALRPLEGHLLVNGVEVAFSSPAEAQKAGIAAVHQDLQLFPEMDVATNVYAIDHALPRKNPLRTIDWVTVRERTSAFLSELGIAIDPDRTVATLSVAQRKLVQIARAVALRSRVLILDEPTASLERRAARGVLDLLVRLREGGLAVCVVGHRLDEVRAIADEITVLRDGRVAGRLEGVVTERQLVHLMLGRTTDEGIETHEPARSLDGAAPVLQVRDLAIGLSSKLVSFDLHRGEILGLTGLMGAGAESVVRMIAGAESCTGRLIVNGREVRIHTPSDALAVGIAFIPEDRKHEGIFGGMTVAENISIASLESVSRLGMLRRSLIMKRALSYVTLLGIRTSSVFAPVSSLSGGNQQKVLAARCLATEAKILVLHEPTHGVDVGAIVQIQQLLRNFAKAGGAVIVASGEVRQLLQLCDRIAVFRDAAVVATLSPRGNEASDIVLAAVRDPEELIDSLMSETTASKARASS
jgi:ABC-type sugar transport system ATPase subunit